MMDNLPIDLLEVILINVDLISHKFNLKLISRFFNDNVYIPFNFSNKFKLFSEQNKYDYSNINFTYLYSLDRLIENPTDLVKITYFDSFFELSPVIVKYDFMLPFSDKYSTSFMIYIDNKHWFWYHNKQIEHC